MAKPVTGQTTFGASTTGTTTQLDNNFLLAYNALNQINTYETFLIDSGAANAYVVTFPASLTGSLLAGLGFWIFPANTNTAGSTLNANATGVKSIKNGGREIDAGMIRGNIPAFVVYDGTYYDLLNPQYGFWTTPAFNAGNFTANGSMTWTVGAGDVTTLQYTIRNREMTVAWLIGSSDVGGTPNTILQILIPAGFTSTKGIWNACFNVDASSAAGEVGACRVTAGGTTIDIIRNASAVWTAGANVSVAGEITFEIT